MRMLNTANANMLNCILQFFVCLYLLRKVLYMYLFSCAVCEYRRAYDVMNRVWNHERLWNASTKTTLLTPGWPPTRGKVPQGMQSFLSQVLCKDTQDGMGPPASQTIAKPIHSMRTLSLFQYFVKKACSSRFTFLYIDISIFYLYISFLICIAWILAAAVATTIIYIDTMPGSSTICHKKTKPRMGCKAPDWWNKHHMRMAAGTLMVPRFANAADNQSWSSRTEVLGIRNDEHVPVW